MILISKLTLIIFVSFLLIFSPFAGNAQIVVIPDCDEVFDPRPECNEGVNPVVLVPGLLTSFNIETILQDEESDEWDFISPARPVYRGLIERLEGAGADVFVAHYDWRQSNSESVGEYLIPTIEAAKQATGAEKVDIVAHSMGGILARDYIQGTQYNDDVDDLILIGTPNRGASDAYITWEGGEFPDRWGVGPTFYIEMVERSLKFHRVLPAIERPESFRTFFPSLHDLLPVYNFVEYDGGLFPTVNLADRNVYLDSLAATKGRIEERGVDQTTIAGTSVATLNEIPLSSERTIIDELLSRWRDGHPDPDPPEPFDDGDKTVLAHSARLDGTHITIVDAEHDKLPEEAQEEVLGILGFEETGSHIAYDLPQSVVGAVVLSPVDPVITGPNGEVLSEDTTTFADAEYISDPDDPNGPKLLSITNPPPGDYTLQLTGTDTGDYTVITSFADETGVTTAEQTGTTTEGKQEVYSFTATVDEDDFTLTPLTVRELSQQMVTLATDARSDRVISSWEMVSITRPALQTWRFFNAYERFATRGLEERAATYLADFHAQLDAVAAAVDAIAATPGREDFVATERGLMQQISAFVP